MRGSRAVPALVLLALICGSSAGAQVTLAPQVPYLTTPSGLRPNALVTGDLDGDGDNDLATANANSDNVSILLNNGTGTFVSGGVFAANTFPVDLAAADLDGDGDLDLAVANYDFANPRVSVLLNQGGATFVLASSLALAARPSGIVAADFTGDGTIDLAVSIFDFGGSASVLRNSGGATFVVHSTRPTGQNSFGIAAGDFDGVNGPDLVVANDQAANVSVLLNTGGGLLAAAENYPSALAPAAVAVGDLDDDGDLDVAAANRGGNKVFVHWNDGTGAFSTASSFTAGFGQLSVAIDDLDCDGRSDLAVVDNQPDRLGVLRYKGNHTFAPVQQFPLPDDPRDVTTADFGDFGGTGEIDLATASTNSSTVSVLLNTTPLTAAGLAIFAAGIRGDQGQNPPPAGTEYASPSPALATFLAGANPLLSFDQGVINRRFGHTFTGLPGHLVGATLTFRISPGAGSNNDSISLGFDGASAFTWSRQFQTFLPNSWVTGTSQVATLDLANLPGGGNLLAQLEADRRLDVYVQDDTLIDYLVLRLRVCKRTPFKLSPKGPLLRGQTVTLKITGVPGPPAQVVTVGGSYAGIDPGSFLPLFDTRVCLNPPIFVLGSGVTNAIGTVAITWTVPATGPPQQYLSMQAVVSSGGGLLLSNSITEPIF